ncbi:hypothetical protein N6L26_04020 [Qipengyuania sp. SS22]|uniref:hypothetical protein n=1 Tax=Qipengyuania sp. SS22 TaxID=2979461 RepID=UPI0021E5DAAA|nr:hypothetical protein [Qipengyuania sp. SS22]UYH55733.1 hypothetical protein N6L26_04020 [Qipengyuania sp. SS22]
MSEFDRGDYRRALLGELAYLPDDDELHEWRGLNDVLVGVNRWRETPAEEIDGPAEIEVAVEILDDAYKAGLIEFRGSNSARNAEMMITHQGILETNFSAYIDPDDDGHVDHQSELDDLQKKIDSTSWTGLAVAASPAKIAIIREKSEALYQAIMQSDADLETRTNACKRVQAVILLLEAPNSPWPEIVSLLNHPSVTAFLATMNLLQFILGMAN